jgi:hypothetical protein
VRLDHLLSKEQLTSFRGCAVRQIRTECVLLVAHGWNIDIGAQAKGSGLVRRLCCFDSMMVGTIGVGGLGACTLLGPEGPDDSAPFGCGGDGFSQAFTETSCCWWGWGFWPSVENYIVDASILEAARWAVSH